MEIAAIKLPGAPKHTLKYVKNFLSYVNGKETGIFTNVVYSARV